MLKFVQFGVLRAYKIGVLNLVNRRRLGMGPKTALSIDKVFDSAEKVNVLSSTLVSLYRARDPLFNVEL